MGLNDAKAEIDALGATARTRSITVEEVEQDIWIEWIADLTDDDLLDEDDITDHLEKLNVIGEGRVFWDEGRFNARAAEAERRLRKLGLGRGRAGRGQCRASKTRPASSSNRRGISLLRGRLKPSTRRS